MVANTKIRRYTADEKAKATARAIEVGYRAASDELGIPWGTLSCWVFKARQAGAGSTPSPMAVLPSAPEVPVAAPGASPVPKPPHTPPSGVAATASAEPASSVPSPRPTSRSRVAKVYTPSQIAHALERVAAIGVRPAAKELGISRNALRDWERKVEKAAKGEGPAPTSGPDPKTIEERRDASILAEWRKQQGLGPSQIRNQLRRAGIKVSV